LKNSDDKVFGVKQYTLYAGIVGLPKRFMVVEQLLKIRKILNRKVMNNLRFNAVITSDVPLPPIGHGLR